MRATQHIGKRHQENVFAVLVADMHRPGTPVIRRLARYELAHDRLGALMRLHQILDFAAIIIEQHPLAAGTVKKDVGHVLVRETSGRLSTFVPSVSLVW